VTKPSSKAYGQLSARSASLLSALCSLFLLSPLLLPAGETCVACHGEIVESYSHTAHFQASRPASAESIRGDFADGRNILRTRVEGTWFRMERRGDAFYQTGHENSRTRSERFDLVIGSGRRGQSYLYWRDGLLYQLPVSWFAASNDWVNSPGFEDGKVYFDRLILLKCLDCHTTSFRYTGDQILGIQCQKCHGEGAHPQIRNPARFSRDQKVALCAACHSGLSPLSLKPDVHGNQAGLLRSSKCFRSSPTMACTTCHNIHRVERDVVQLSQGCTGCHPPARCKQAARADNCIDCHMPRQKSDAITFNAPGKQFSQYYRTHAIGVYGSRQ